MQGLGETPIEAPRVSSAPFEDRGRRIQSGANGAPDDRSPAPRSRAAEHGITVVVADEEPARRAACVRILEPERGIRVVAQADTAALTLESARLRPRILLVDANLAMREGIALLPMFRRHSPRTKVIVLTGQTSGAALLPALALGAQGYLNRRAMRPLLPKAVRKVDAGEAWISRRLLPRIIERLARLSERR